MKGWDFCWPPAGTRNWPLTISQQAAPFTLFGNRGVIHSRYNVTKQFQNIEWIYCSTKGLATPREFMRQGRYTELFFLDEATALAAGHRPCGQCENSRQLEFTSMWKKTFPDDDSLEQIDRKLHSSRINESGSKTVFETDCSELPNGAMIRDPHSSGSLLIRNEFVYPWTPQGYGVRLVRPKGTVEVLTPRPTVSVLARGFTVGPNEPLLAW